MRKQCMFLLIILLALPFLSAENIKIYAPVAQNFLIDANNSVRYSPINIFDDDVATVYAVSIKTINNKKPLLEIYFAEPVRFDKLSINAGYFDEKYYKKNNRLKNVKLQIYNSNHIDYEKIVDLKDEMLEQNIYSGKVIVSTKIVLYVNETFSGTKWDDLVIAELNFYINGKKEKISFGKGKCIYGETYHDYKYDNQGRLIYESSQYGHAGGDEKYYKYENSKILMAYVGMEDDPSELIYKEINSIDDKIKGTNFYYENGVVVSEKYERENSFYISQYLYDQSKRLICIVRICENSNWGNKYIEYEYNEDGLVIKKTGYEDATIYTDRYE